VHSSDGHTNVAEFDNRMQAEIVVNLLRSFGIQSWIVADDLGGIGPGQSFLHGVKVVVEAADSARARGVLDTRSRPDEGNAL